MAIHQRAAYAETRRKLVLAFDLGTTYSGVSYSILDPGQVPEVKGVTRYPGNEVVSGASKIPTIIYYDRAGVVKAIGAETMRDGIEEEALENRWIKAEWFKLHLRSDAQRNPNNTELLGEAQAMIPLPPNKTIVDLFADFFRYLFRCAAQYIQETYANDAYSTPASRRGRTSDDSSDEEEVWEQVETLSQTLWASVERNIDFVLSHPNGWEGREQAEMRQAAVRAGLIPDTPSGHQRIRFVTEGEASLHYAIQRGILSRSMQSGAGVIVVDAGGGTIDVSAYRADPASKTFEEIAAPQCHLHGSVFVSIHLRAFLQGFLEDSPFHEDIDHIVKRFDNSTKLRFKNEADPQYVKFGSARDNDQEHNIRFGQLRLAGTDVASFFQPSVDCIVNAVLEQKEASDYPINHVVLVGGFSASDWLLHKVMDELDSTGLHVFRPEDYIHNAKAVSDGAVSFYVDHFVRVRVSRFSFGTIANTMYDSNDADHVRRIAAGKGMNDIDGGKVLPNCFFVLLPKGTQISETQEFKKTFSMVGFDKSHFQTVSNPIWSYRGQMNPCPKWKDVDPTNFRKFCDVSADLSRIPMVPEENETGFTYYPVQFDIILLFGMTEIQAQMAWFENGVEQRGPATIRYARDV